MANGPMVVVTSYSKFDNLAHSPRGTQADISVRTYRLDPTSGQLTLIAVYWDQDNRYKSSHTITYKNYQAFAFQLHNKLPIDKIVQAHSCLKK